MESIDLMTHCPYTIRAFLLLIMRYVSFLLYSMRERESNFTYMHTKSSVCVKWDRKTPHRRRQRGKYPHKATLKGFPLISAWAGRLRKNRWCEKRCLLCWSVRSLRFTSLPPKLQKEHENIRTNCREKPMLDKVLPAFKPEGFFLAY